MAKKNGFEKQMERLQAVVVELEQGDIPLEKTVALYKEGNSLLAACREQLENARHAITVSDASGSITPFVHNDTEEEPQ